MVDLRLSVEDTNRIRSRLGIKLIPLQAQDGIEPQEVAEDPVEAQQLPESSTSRKTASRSTAQDLVSGEGLASNTESTKSWLARLKASHIKPEGTIPPAPPHEDSSPLTLPVPTHPAYTGDEKPVKNTNADESIQPSSVADAAAPSQPSRETASELKRAVETYDPLEIDPTVESGPRKGGLDYDMSKAVKFKPKKIKKDQSRRARAKELSSEKLDLLRKTFEEKQKAEDQARDEHAIEVDQMIAANRLAKQKLLGESDHKEPIPSFQEKKADNLIVSDTNRFLDNMRRKVANLPSAQASQAAVDGAIIDTVDGNEPLTSDADSRQPQDAKEAISPTNETHHRSLGGLAETLKLLHQRGSVEPQNVSSKRNRDWARKLVQERKTRKEELDEQSKAFEHLPTRERRELRELQDKQAAREEAQLAQEQFADYNPEVKLTYRDNRGEIIDSKEAFRQLSRKFHGTAEGKKRAERRQRH